MNKPVSQKQFRCGLRENINAWGLVSLGQVDCGFDQTTAVSSSAFPGQHAEAGQPRSQVRPRFAIVADHADRTDELPVLSQDKRRRKRSVGALRAELFPGCSLIPFTVEVLPFLGMQSRELRSLGGVAVEKIQGQPAQVAPGMVLTSTVQPPSSPGEVSAVHPLARR